MIKTCRWWHSDTRGKAAGRSLLGGALALAALLGLQALPAVAIGGVATQDAVTATTTASANETAELPTTVPVTSREIGDGVWWAPALLDETSVTQVLDDLSTWGVSNLYICVFDSGYTLYPSRVFTPRPDGVGRDWLHVVLAEARRRQIRVHAWVPVLYWPYADERQAALKEYPQWLEVDRDGLVSGATGTPGRYISPAAPGFQQSMQEMLIELCEYPLDGIHLDAVAYNSARDSGYHPTIVRDFRRESGDVDPAGLRRDDAPDSDWMRWVAFREDALTSMVQVLTGQVRDEATAQNRRILLSAAVVPGYEATRGMNSRYQNWTQWLEEGLVDFVTPQCFENDLSELEQQLWETRNYYQKYGVACVPGLKIEPAGNAVAPTLAEQKRVLANVGFQFATIMNYTTLRESMLE